LETLCELREKFLKQEYPLDVINRHFEKALKMERLNLLFKNPAIRKKSKKKVIGPLTKTFNPRNPPVRTWINEGLEFVHSDDEVKNVLPDIDVLYIQDKTLEEES
jgi:hypothetical protein